MKFTQVGSFDNLKKAAGAQDSRPVPRTLAQAKEQLKEIQQEIRERIGSPRGSFAAALLQGEADRLINEIIPSLEKAEK